MDLDPDRFGATVLRASRADFNSFQMSRSLILSKGQSRTSDALRAVRFEWIPYHAPLGVTVMLVAEEWETSFKNPRTPASSEPRKVNHLNLETVRLGRSEQSKSTLLEKIPLASDGLEIGRYTVWRCAI